MALGCLPLGADDAVVLTQADGSTLALEQTAKSLVTLSPHLTELVFAAGAGTLLLGTVEFSEYPEHALAIPRVGDAFRLDIERIIALRPDLVIAWDSGNPKAAVSQLRSLGIPVWSVEIREPEEIMSVLHEIGSATGHSSIADPLAQQLSRRLDQLSEQYQGAAPLNYFYQVDARPLFTINGDHLISKGLALCGGRNIFEEEPGLAFQVSHESVIVANPDVLFAPHPENTPDPLSAWQEWPAMRSVQSNALFLLPADKISRATPRWLDSLELACTLMNGLR